MFRKVMNVLAIAAFSSGATIQIQDSFATGYLGEALYRAGMIERG